jgi:hypothetical protein
MDKMRCEVVMAMVKKPSTTEALAKTQQEMTMQSGVWKYCAKLGILVHSARSMTISGQGSWQTLCLSEVYQTASCRDERGL